MPQDNAFSRYQKKVLVRRSFNLNRNTDADIIKRLEQVDNVQGYIKRCIREEMERSKAKEQA